MFPQSLTVRQLALMFLVFTLGVAGKVGAVISTWNPGCASDYFDSPPCWSTVPVPPGPLDTASFGAGSVEVLWDGFVWNNWSQNWAASTVTNDQLVVTGTVTFKSAPEVYVEDFRRTYTLTAPTGIEIIGGVLNFGEAGTDYLILEALGSIEVANLGAMKLRGGSRASADRVNVGLGTAFSTLNIESDADLVSEQGNLGNSSVTLSDTGSTWNNNGGIYVGGDNVAAAGTATLTINPGTQLNTDILKAWDNGTIALQGGAITTRRFNSIAGTFNFTRGTLTVDGGKFESAAPVIVIDNVVGGETSTLELLNGTVADTLQDLTVGRLGRGAVSLTNGSLMVQYSTVVSNAIVGEKPGSSGTITVTGADSQWNLYADRETGITVGDEGNGVLNIENGAKILLSGDRSSIAAIGSASTSTGTVNVRGNGSQWSFLGPELAALIVGSRGEGEVTIEAGGVITLESSGEFQGSKVNIGNIEGTGVVTVDGPGSQLYLSGTWGEFSVGSNSANGTLNITNGGNVSILIPFLSVIGGDAASSGAVNISGENSSWSAQGGINVGGAGTAPMDISDGGTIIADSFLVASQSSGTGTITVGGSGSALNSIEGIWVGGSSFSSGGLGTVNVDLGGLVDAGAVLKLWEQGTLNLSGGTVMTDGIDASLGTFNFSSGTLVVRNDLVRSALGPIATLEPGMALTVGGATTVSIANPLTVDGGTFSTGSLNAEAGSFTLLDGIATVDGGSYNDGATHLVIDRIEASDSPTLVLSNGASALGAGDSVIGALGNGLLRIETGSMVSGASASIGDAPGSTGSAAVIGPASSWSNTSSMVVGNGGIGTLLIETGGTVSNASGIVGAVFGSTGVAVVTGNGASWTNLAGVLTIGDYGTGSLELHAGGEVSNTFGIIGNQLGSKGSVLVTGTNSAWMNAADLAVGEAGAGTLSIAEGGRVSNTSASIGSSSGGTGTVAVGGFGAIWTNSGNLAIGGNPAEAGGTGLLTVNAGGIVEVSGELKTWGAGTVILAGGTVTIGTLVNTGNFVLGSGVLNLTDSNLTVGPGGQFETIVSPVEINLSNGDLNVAAGSTFTTSANLAANNINNNGSVSHIGGDTVVADAGTIINDIGAHLSIASTSVTPVEYGADSATAIPGLPSVQVNNHGDLLLNDVDLIADLHAFPSSTLTVIQQATIWGTLSGDTSIFGPGTTSVLGGLDPGTSAGFLSVESDLDLGGSPYTILEIDGNTAGSNYDRVRVGGELTLGGVLDIRLLHSEGTYTPRLGDTFAFVSAGAIFGEFDDVLLPDLEGGLAWLVNRNATEFSVSVASAVPLPPSLYFMIGSVIALWSKRMRGNAAGSTL